ncbi:MAG: sensor domain-containing diguanylate cyclase [Myxococcota bacterium]
MQEPEIPHNEAARLRALTAACLLDTAPEERFDRYTRLARRLFDVPIALVSLVDASRQWFKSRDGLDATETPREISFCGHAILGSDVFVIPDARADARFADNPLVTAAPDIAFYAGAPVHAPDGSALGTLCIIDRVPREFSDEDREALRDLAKMVEHECAIVQLATTDALTGLSNRRGFEALADHSLAMCRRMGAPARLLYFDLDKFKAINDTHGHAAGDRTLRDFAAVLLDTFREVDIIARLGGDEFCVLIVDGGKSAVAMPVQRFAQAVAAHNTTSERPWPLEYSVGTVEFDPAVHVSVADLLSEADRRMYDAKHGAH